MAAAPPISIDRVRVVDLPLLLPMVRAYCDFYEVAPRDDRLVSLSRALIEACRVQAREHGAVWLGWQTAKDNARAQRVYDRVGGERSEWIDYGLRP